MCKIARERGLETFKLDMKQLSKKPLRELLGTNFIEKSSKECIMFCESLGCIEKPLEIVDGFCLKNNELRYLLFSFPNQNSIIRKVVNFLHNNEVKYFLARLRALGPGLAVGPGRPWRRPKPKETGKAKKCARPFP